MRARALALSILSSAAVLAVGWQLGTSGQTQAAPDAAASGTAGSAAPAPTPTPTPSTSNDGSAATATATPAPSATSTPDGTAGSTDSAAAAAPSASGVSGTFTGSSVQTRFGPVQVQITVTNGSITDVAALQLTDKDQRSVSISNRAAPVLRQQVLAAQSANVQGVSGATYTSEAYLGSLQSALDQAGL